MRPSPSPDDLLWWLMVNSRTDGDCRVWKRPTRTKLASAIRIDGVIVRAPRVALQLATGETGEGLLVYHHCRNPLCVKPEHLLWGDKSDVAATPKTRRRRKAGSTWEQLETILR
jgi:hypothetical protein